MTKILAIGDPHFRTDNVSETELFCNELKSYLSTSDADIIIVLGDILHTHEKLHTSALNAAVDFFKMLTSFSKPTFVLVGNHDAISNTIFLTTNHWLNILKNWNTITVVDYPTKFFIKEKEFITLCPYVPDGRLVEALELIPDWKESKIIFGHQLLNGAKMGMIVASNVEEWKDDYPLLISGHIHDRQRVKKNLYYTGSSLQHSFGETGDKSLCLLNTANNNSIEDIYLSVKRKKILYASVDDLEEITKKMCEDIEYKIVLKGNVDDFKALKKSSLFKETMELENVKNISFKAVVPEVDIKDELTGQTDDFCEHLNRLVQSTNDPYLISLYEHVLYDKEDVSDKDVLIF